jgi:hypothetical protein
LAEMEELILLKDQYKGFVWAVAVAPVQQTTAFHPMNIVVVAEVAAES